MAEHQVRGRTDYSFWTNLGGHNGEVRTVQKNDKVYQETTFQCRYCDKRFGCKNGGSLFVYHCYKNHHTEFLKREKAIQRRKIKAEMLAAGVEPQPPLRRVVEEQLDVLGKKIDTKSSRQSVAVISSALDEKIKKLELKLDSMAEDFLKFQEEMEEKEKEKERKKKAEEDRLKSVLCVLLLFILFSSVSIPTNLFPVAASVACGVVAFWYYKQTGKEEDEQGKVISIERIPDVEEEENDVEDEEEENSVEDEEEENAVEDEEAVE